MKYLIKLLFIALFLTGFTTILKAQDEAPAEETTLHSPNIEFIYIKNSDGARSLVCNLTITIERTQYPLKGSVLNFHTGNNGETSLGNAVTNANGRAVCIVPPNFNLPLNEEGKFTFTCEFEGNDTVEAGSEQLQYKDLIIELVLSEEDSIKTATVNAYQTDQNGGHIPLSNEAVNIYIPRMFSNLLVGEIKLDSSGTGSLIIPDDIPGDSAGTLKIIARLDDHSDFGNVEKWEIKKWGIPKEKVYHFSHTLWSEIAPTWMIITLTILLLGVWAHYLFVIFKLVKVGKTGRKITEENNT